METVIRATRRAVQAEEWALVLAAAGIPHRVEPTGDGWTLLVPADAAPRARAALDAYEYEEEAHAEPPALSDGAVPQLAWTVGVAVGALLLAFFALTGPPAPGSSWFERGAARAGQILGGEPWRAVTALTLHVDLVHVTGNAVASAALLSATVQQLGPGLGLTLVLLAGAGANVVGAMAHDPGHVAVGASTATFGAIGILAALRLFRAPPARTKRKPWVVLVASLMLLALLGTSPGSDVLGHGLGLLSGGALGLAAGIVLRRPPGPSVQWRLVLMDALVVVACWGLALVGAAS